VQEASLKLLDATVSIDMESDPTIVIFVSGNWYDKHKVPEVRHPNLPNLVEALCTFRYITLSRSVTHLSHTCHTFVTHLSHICHRHFVHSGIYAKSGHLVHSGIFRCPSDNTKRKRK